ncbi:MAG: hypothetical protein M0Q87_04825 [Ottowia sp.]|nr:hypothetical protein [Ottowia sp.]
MSTVEIDAIWSDGRLQLPQGVRLRGHGVKLRLRVAESDVIRQAVPPARPANLHDGGLEQRIANILGSAAKPRPAQTASQDRDELMKILDEHRGNR